MKRKILIAASVLAVALAGVGFAWSGLRQHKGVRELTLYGNVDLRQIDLAFNNSERIQTITVQEGDRVHTGQVLARLDAERLQPQFDEAEAQVDAQSQVVARLHRGSRPEEIEQARANLASARADAVNARQQYERLELLFNSSAGRAASQQDLDNAKSAFDVATAKVVVNQKALDLAVAGPRSEDISQAQAQLRAGEAHVQLLHKQLADSELVAPANAVVRSRLMEPGEIATPQRPVFSLAVVDPKWVRTYVPESDLGKVHPGMAAKVSADSFPNRQFAGWVGFISPVAEFTPRTVQTTELRTSLVYEVRVFVKDSTDELRLGMPATVRLLLDQPQRIEPSSAKVTPSERRAARS